MSRATHNLVYLLVTQVATWAVTLLVLLVVPDLLGADGFGEIGFAAFYMQFFVLAASLGTSMYLTREVARDPSILETYVYNGVLLKIVTGLVASVLAVVIASAFGTEGTKLVLVVLGCFTMLFVITNEVFVGALAGLERMGRAAMWATVYTYVASIGGVLTVLAGGGVIAYSVVLCLAGLIPLVANGRRVWPWTVWRRLITGGFPLMILSGLVLVYGTVDVPMLSVIAGDTQVGWYTLAYRFVGIPIFIASATMTAFFPSISAHGVAINDDFVRLVNRSIRLVVLVSVPASAGIAVLADRIIRLLYDEEFSGAISIMQILALSIPLTALGVALGTALIASNRQNGYLIVAGIAAVLNPLSCWFAIHWAIDRYDNGAVGAALVTVGTELFIFAGALMLRTRGVMDRATVWYIVRTLLASGVMALAMEITLDLPLAVLCAVGVVVYGSVSLLLGTLKIGEIRGFAAVLRGAVGTARGGEGQRVESGDAASDAAPDRAAGATGGQRRAARVWRSALRRRRPGRADRSARAGRSR
jgi:O-antigen/teichoic acid export membrane protein